MAKPLGIKIALCAAIIAGAALAAFYTGDYSALDYIKEQRARLIMWREQNELMAPVLFGLAYVLATAFSVPVGAGLTLLGGTVFGFGAGLFIVSFAGAAGATLAFLLARFLFQDKIKSAYSERLEKINSEFSQNGALYLLALRLTPLVPFFLVNILMAMTSIKTRTFYACSQIGMLPLTAVYAYAGSELAKINTLSDIASPWLMPAFTLLGLTPLLAAGSGCKKALNVTKNFFRKPGSSG